MHTHDAVMPRACTAGDRHPEGCTGLNRRILVAFVGFACLIWAAAPTAWADYWYEHYSRAEAALADGDWDAAVVELQQALERKGDSGARVRWYGMKVLPYFPYLKLGIAYYHLGQYEAALQAFQTEEQLGAIVDSTTDMEELRHYRRLALDAREDLITMESERKAQIVSESLKEAEILERQGRLEAAMDALGKGLAVDQENPDAVAKMQELRAEVVRRERRRLDDDRAADLVSRGRAELDEGNFAEASSLFQQASSLRPNASTQHYLELARAGLAAEIQAEEDEGARQAVVANGLNRARDLERSGSYSEALDQLQRVLAADPTNATAIESQSRILEIQKRIVDRESLTNTLEEAVGLFAAGEYEAAISASNRVLAIDPGNAAALEQVRKAYGEISNRLLGSRTVENIPPAIRFADFRIDQPDGRTIQIVRQPDFRLSGVVIDNSPVEIQFQGTDGQIIEGRSASQRVGEYFITEFALSDHLIAGWSAYSLTATDSAGLSSRAEYAVIYEVPFYRERWFQFAMAALPVAVLAGVWVYRSRHRRRLMTRRFNPYIAGAPVLDREMFFGREQLVERILQTIHNNSLLLYGERRIGKTSLQHHIRRRLLEIDDPQYAFFPVYIDLQGTPESQFFSTLAEDIFHELAPLLDGATAGSDLPPGSVYGYRELVHDLRKVIKKLEAASDKQVKLVLLIDEVDELNAYDPRVNQRLRSLFMKSFAENLVAVVSGVEIRKQWDKEGSPWYNFFEEIEVTPIERDHAVDLITRPIGGVFKFDDAVVDRIIELTERKPYRVQRLCIALVNRMYEGGRRQITTADVDAVAGIDESTG